MQKKLNSYMVIWCGCANAGGEGLYKFIDQYFEKDVMMITYVNWLMNMFYFQYIGNNHPNWLIFFKMVKITNQELFGNW